MAPKKSAAAARPCVWTFAKLGPHKLRINFSLPPPTPQHLPPFSVLQTSGVKTLAQLKAGNQSVTS